MLKSDAGVENSVRSKTISYVLTIANDVIIVDSAHAAPSASLTCLHSWTFVRRGSKYLQTDLGMVITNQRPRDLELVEKRTNIVEIASNTQNSDDVIRLLNSQGRSLTPPTARDRNVIYVVFSFFDDVGVNFD